MPLTVNVAGELTLGGFGLTDNVTGSEPMITDVDSDPESPELSVAVAVAV